MNARRSLGVLWTDLEQLYRRLLFSLLIDNSDDHLKNHGMLAVNGNRYVLRPFPGL